MNEKCRKVEVGNKYEKIIIELSEWTPGEKLSKVVTDEVGEINSSEQRDLALKMIDNFLGEINNEEGDGKLYLSEIIEIEKPLFGLNNLILSPVGSGKTHFMRSLIEDKDNILLLVSTSSLKNKFVPTDERKRKEIANRFYSTKRKTIHGESAYKVLVMTYAEFGENIKYTDRFARKFTKIFCDEIHSLPLYQKYNDSSTLLVAMHYLFNVHENQPKYYFTATQEHLDELRKQDKYVMSNIKVFNYLNYPNVKKYVPMSSYKIHGMEQTRPHLKARKESIKYFGHKVFAFCKTIESQLRLKDICLEEGLTAEAYWSNNNTDKPMSVDQIDEVETMITNERLPDKYDVVIINSALQEGWDIKDERVKMAIMNTTNETEFIQALGRLRRNVDVLVYKVSRNEEVDFYINFPHELIEVPLDVDMKDSLRIKFDLRDRQGRLVSWKVIETTLERQGFLIVNKQLTIDGERKRVSIVYSR